MNKKRLTLEDRMLLQQLLFNNYSQKRIAEAIGVSPSTISREIKNHRQSNDSIIICDKTERYPFICRCCDKKSHCKRKKYFYNYKTAHQQYISTLKSSRIGIDMSIDEIEYWNDFFEDRIKNKNQPILHIFDEIRDSFPKTLPTFYSYVHKGYFPSINDEMLSRSSSYKPRKKKEIEPKIKANSAIKIGRTMDDFYKYIEQHPNANICQMDTVIGKFEDKNCLLTLYSVKQKIMFIFFIKKYKPSEVSKVFDYLKAKLGNIKFNEIFEVILTDNGWEFSRPDEIELDKNTGKKIANVFFTDSYSAWQKGGIERNHEFIRYIIPKGLTFDNLTKKNVIDMTNHINNIHRKSLDYQTPYDLFINKYGFEIAKIFHLTQIPRDEINLSYKLLLK